jgi:Tol biopolymer transport system component
VFAARNQIWALPRTAGFLRSEVKPIQLTSSPIPLTQPIPSKDGTKLYVVGTSIRGELLRYDAKSKQFAPFLGGISAEFVDFSRDGEWVTYVSYPEGTLWRSKVDGSERLQLTYPPLYALMPRWSPDGKTIVFFDVAANKPSKIYEVSREGGSPRPMMPDYPGNQLDPNWSPDGTKLVFGGASRDPASDIRIFDLATHQVSTVPGSQGLFSPRWSPDGRSLAAVSVDQKRLLVFDFQTQRWSEMTSGAVIDFHTWSKDGQFLYFLRQIEPGAVVRIRISDHKLERLLELKNIALTGHWGHSMALSPDGSPLLLRNAGTQDIYALDWEEP